MKWRAVAVLAGVIVVAGAAVLWLGRAKPIVVDTVEITRGKVDETVTNTRAGSIKACQRAKLAPTKFLRLTMALTGRKKKQD